MNSTQKITPCLWFDKNCEEAINFYIETFNKAPDSPKNSKIISILRYPEGKQIGPVPDMEGKILTAIFELDAQRFMALDGGPMFKLTEAVSFNVDCRDQEEIDYFWNRFSAEPEAEACGWLKDKFGLSWQIIPESLGGMLSDQDKSKASRVMDSMLKMKKIDVGELERAYNQ